MGLVVGWRLVRDRLTDGDSHSRLNEFASALFRLHMLLDFNGHITFLPGSIPVQVRVFHEPCPNPNPLGQTETLRKMSLASMNTSMCFTIRLFMMLLCCPVKYSSNGSSIVAIRRDGNECVLHGGVSRIRTSDHTSGTSDIDAEPTLFPNDRSRVTLGRSDGFHWRSSQRKVTPMIEPISDACQSGFLQSLYLIVKAIYTHASVRTTSIGVHKCTKSPMV